MLRIGVIGARRHRQGIGFHLARFAAGAGARVVGVVGTRPKTVAEAIGRLAQVGVETRGYLDACELLQDARPDALVIASPAHTHEGFLTLALEHGVHVLCEKPLCWGGPDPAGRARGISSGFLERGLNLGVNAQWPWTLDTYRCLFPRALRDVPRTFTMRLSPRRPGRPMIPDALPHALSLLAAALPDTEARVEAPLVALRSPDASHVEVTFRYTTVLGGVDARVELVATPAPPRAAAYGFDGQVAHRHVQMEGYRLTLAGAGRQVILPDPTPRLVSSFLSRVSSSAVPQLDPNAWPGMLHLQVLDAAWPVALPEAGDAHPPSATT